MSYVPTFYIKNININKQDIWITWSDYKHCKF